MVVKSWSDWWLIRKCFLESLAKEEQVDYLEIEICFRLQNKVCEGIG